MKKIAKEARCKGTSGKLYLIGNIFLTKWEMSTHEAAERTHLSAFKALQCQGVVHAHETSKKKKKKKQNKNVRTPVCFRNNAP